jgi:hypothetical protein
VTDEAAGSARGLRRLLVVLLIAAAAAAGAALGLALTPRDDSSTTPSTRPPSLFAPTFRDSTFLAGTAHLVASRDADAATRRLVDALALPTDGTAYVVARCDRGKVTVTAGALTSSRPCTGAPVGVIALQMGSPATLTASVSATQSARWGVAVYR